MARFLSDQQSDDFYVTPVFSLENRLRRLLWQFFYILFFRPSPRPFFGWRAWLLRCFGAKIGTSNFIYPSAKIWAPWLLETEHTATIGPEVEIYNPGGVFLGHHAIVSQNAFICGGSHDFNNPAFPMTWKPIRLEAYAWVCARAIVLPGVTMEEGAILGAGAVTSRRLPAWTVWAGNPARQVTLRSHGGSAPN